MLLRIAFAFLRALGTGFLLCLFLLQNAAASPFEETVRILENNTSFHWGRDCLVWIVHYPEDLVDPWVDSEASRAGMTESERAAYKKNFVSELSMGEAEPFLFTVHAFGPRSFSFAPVSETIALVTAEGKRIQPARYDKKLDQPITGVVQGLIFFPKQKGRKFSVAVQGMGVYDERLFAFGDAPGEELFVSAPVGAEPDVVIVDLPPAPAAPKNQNKTPAPRKEVPKAPIQRPSETPEPSTPSPVPPVPPAPPAREEPRAGETRADARGAAPELKEPENSQSMAEFVEALRAGRGKKPEGAKEETNAQDTGNAYISREKAVKDFLGLWLKNDYGNMYAMLSELSRKSFTREAFGLELEKAADFKAALRDGYTIDWQDNDRAKVVAVRRVLLIRSLTSRVLGVAREGSAWKIVW
jgi:hypothetical protein